MSIFRVFDIAGSAMTAQSLRLNTVASNLANAESTVGPDGETYQAKQVRFMAESASGPAGAQGVRAVEVVNDQRPPQYIYDPAHPDADSEGYVAMPNVNVVEEMVNMLSATRAYQTNVDTLNAAKSMLQKTLSIGQS